MVIARACYMLVACEPHLKSEHSDVVRLVTDSGTLVHAIRVLLVKQQEWTQRLHSQTRGFSSAHTRCTQAHTRRTYLASEDHVRGHTSLLIRQSSSHMSAREDLTMQTSVMAICQSAKHASEPRPR